MAVDIVFETSAATVEDEAGVSTGWRPGRLSERGRRQAQELGERRRTDGFNIIFCSDLPHSVETTQIAFPLRELPMHFETRLRECDYGKLTGRPLAELAPVRPRHVTEPFPGGQSYQQVVEQTAGFLRDLAAAWDGTRVLLVAHSSNRWALEHLLHDVELTALVSGVDEWQPGWSYQLPGDWGRRRPRPARQQPGYPRERSG